NRIKAQSELKQPESGQRVSRTDSGLSRILVKGRESMSFVDIDEIILVQRENNSTVIYTATDSFVTSAKMGDIEQKLDGERFLRSHKSYIINLTKIRTIEPYGRWTYIVNFKDIDKDALLTQENYEIIKQRFG
ncbi:MAG: LytTR family transcriptional regulator, partial [Lachnospiraceae bacterium]|nr:LytTR family transcriptional regulator [Lachnospiraceae bacterium]